MARRSLKPQLNQIRTWVRQGRTDAWIAHQLEVSVSDLRSFKREHDLAPGDEAGDSYSEEELDLRAEDDALVAAALDAEPDEDEDEDDDEDGGGDGDEPDAETAGRRRRRRGRRGGRGRRRTSGRPRALEGTFDHGDEGYGLWLDPAVQEDGVYAEHWAGHRPVTVSIEPDRIVIRRAGEDENGDGDEEPDEVPAEESLDPEATEG